MKKTVVIILIILVILFGGLLLSHNDPSTTVIAPSVTDTSMPTNTVPDTINQPVPSTDGTRVKGPERKTIAIGASAELAGMIIKVTSLAQDSRCPTQVTCIQAGSVGIHATVTKGGVTVDHDFASNTAPFVFEGYSIAMVNVTPVPTTGANAIKLSDYRLTFEATPTAKGDTI
ncbi:MAG: hypothetical protein ABIO57_02585 [Candidatus Paceibacterota bacterium]